MLSERIRIDFRYSFRKREQSLPIYDEQMNKWGQCAASTTGMHTFTFPAIHSPVRIRIRGASLTQARNFIQKTTTLVFHGARVTPDTRITRIIVQ